MPYIEMTLEEALKYVEAGLIDPNTKALVLTQNSQYDLIQKTNQLELHRILYLSSF